MIDVMRRPTDAVYEPQCLPRRRRKIMALTLLKARAGIGVLTFAAGVASFVLATPAKAINIKFLATKGRAG
jgi:hypothetical protein